eukprot:1717558-Rhodomonas_salina.4
MAAKGSIKLHRIYYSHRTERACHVQGEQKQQAGEGAHVLAKAHSVVDWVTLDEWADRICSDTNVQLPYEFLRRVEVGSPYLLPANPATEPHRVSVNSDVRKGRKHASHSEIDPCLSLSLVRVSPTRIGTTSDVTSPFFISFLSPLASIRAQEDRINGGNIHERENSSPRLATLSDYPYPHLSIRHERMMLSGPHHEHEVEAGLAPPAPQS